MKKKKYIGLIVIVSLLTLILIGLIIHFLNRTPIVLYEYYINDNKVSVPGKHLVSYDCTNGVEISYDEKELTYTTNNLKTDSTCKLFFEENMYDYINILGYSNDSIKDNNKITRDNNGNSYYYGDTAKNNIYFNCSDYRDKNTCEVWKIITTEEDNDNRYIKILKSSNLEVLDKSSNLVLNKFSWNGVKEEGLSFENSSLYNLLGAGYYNSHNNYQYIDKDNNIHYLDFTNYGIKNDETRKMIIPKDYKVSKDSNINKSAIDFSRNEYTGLSLNLLVGLPNIRDYVLSMGSSCMDKNILNFNECDSNSYININNGMWLMNVSSLDNTTVYRVLKSKAINPVYPTIEYEVVPVLYIDGNLKIVSGDGSETNPYMIAY